MKGLLPVRNDEGRLSVQFDWGGEVELWRYSDPDRKNLAHSASLYLGKPDQDNTMRPIKQIMKKDHAMEVFRGESAAFTYYGIPKQVYDHLITYKTLNMRVAGGNRALVSEGFVLPADRMKNPYIVWDAISESMDAYLSLVREWKETPQVARAAMPVNATMNPFKLDWNFQTLIESLMPQRIWDRGAQGLTVQVVQAMFSLLFATDRELWESVYEFYGPHAKEWKMAQRKLRGRDDVTVQEFVNALEKHPDSDPTTNPMDMSLDKAIRMLYAPKKSMWD